MKKTLPALFILLTGCGASINYKAADVLSGNTVVLRSGERVIINGIAAPMEGEEGFQDSREMLKRVVSQKPLKIVRKGEAADGSTVADIYVEDMRVADIMVALSVAERARIPRNEATGE